MNRNHMPMSRRQLVGTLPALGFVSAAFAAEGWSRASWL